MTSRSFLTYAIADTWGLFPIDSIVEIYRVVGFRALQNAPRRVIGSCSFRGQPMFGIDIQDVFNVRDHVYNADASLIVTLNQSFLFGILTDKIGEICRIDETQEITRERYPAYVKDRCIRKAYTIGDAMHFEIDFLSLFTEEEQRWLLEHSSQIEDTYTRLHS